MKVIRIRQGECLSSIAKRHGFIDWRKIYDHPRNATFRQKRPNPDCIYPDEELVIPGKETKQKSRETGSRYRFRRSTPNTLLRIVLENEESKPFAGSRYELMVEKKEYEGSTDENGLIEQEIPADAEQGELTLWLGENTSGVSYTWTLKIGHLDPVDKFTGVQARLNNLGFDSGPIDGALGARTKEAVKAFQKIYNLKVDGIPGPQTKAKLLETHGC